MIARQEELEYAAKEIDRMLRFENHNWFQMVGMTSDHLIVYCSKKPPIEQMMKNQFCDIPVVYKVIGKIKPAQNESEAI